MLNNKGWGLGSFLGFTVIFIIFIFIISINAYKIGLNENKPNDIIFDNTSTNFSYSNVENTVKNAARRYMENINDEISHITITELINEKYLSIIKDNSGNTCTGYVNINILDEGFIYVPYIKCGSKYQTTGYNAEFDN